MHLPRKQAAFSLAVFSCSATHFHYTQIQGRISKPRDPSFGNLLPRNATETIADVLIVQCLNLVTLITYTFLLSFLFPSPSQLILLFPSW